MARQDDAGPGLYRPRIEHVDVRAGFFRECEAMLAHAGAAGLQLDEAVRGKLGLLDVGIERRDELLMSELVELHGLLAKAVEPATPRSLELMRWDACIHPRSHRLAPVPALRRLLMIALGFLVLFCTVGFTGKVTLANVEGSLLELEPGLELFAMLMFYFALAGIGASFKCLYDAYQYVQDGTYDPRLDSTYYMRIGLGLISGLLLAQVLNQFVDQTDPEPDRAIALGKPVLALLGGFAAQLVYRALSRLVEALESVFRPEMRTQLQLQEREQRAGQQQAQAVRSAAIAGRGAAIAAALETADDPTKRRELASELMETVLPGFRTTRAGGIVASGPGTTAGGAVDSMFQQADRWLALSRTVVDLLPEGRSAAARKLVGDAQAALREATELRSRVASGDAVGAVQRVLERVLGEENPLVRILRTALGTFGAVLGRGLPGLAAASPVGLVLGVVGIGTRLADDAYERWKTRVLDAPYRPELLPPAAITFNSVLPALKLSPVFADAFADLLAEPEPATIMEIGELALDGEGEALRARYAERFADEAVFAKGLQDFRRALLGGVLAPDIPSETLKETGADSPEALLQALDAVRADPAARQDLELLALLGERVRSGEVSLADIEEAVAEIGDER